MAINRHYKYTLHYSQDHEIYIEIYSFDLDDNSNTSNSVLVDTLFRDMSGVPFSDMEDAEYYARSLTKQYQTKYESLPQLAIYIDDYNSDEKDQIYNIVKNKIDTYSYTDNYKFNHGDIKLLIFKVTTLKNITYEENLNLMFYVIDLETNNKEKIGSIQLDIKNGIGVIPYTFDKRGLLKVSTNNIYNLESESSTPLYSKFEHIQSPNILVL